VEDVVLMVSAVVTEELSITVALAGEHVGALAAPGGLVTAQVRTTLPVNPSLGATTTVEVALCPGTVIEICVPARAKLGTPGPVPLLMKRVVADG
jgi:hypothetical protein